MILGPDQLQAPLYRRSPFQVAFLYFITNGLYAFYWAYMVRRWCAVTLEKPDQVLWKTVALIVPIFNLFMLFELGMMIKGVAYRAGFVVNTLFAMLGILAFVVTLLSRLHFPYGSLALLSFLPITVMHFAFEQAQLRIHGDAAWPRAFSWIEWIIIGLFGLLNVLFIVGIALPNAYGGDTRPNFQFVYGAYVTALAALAIIKVRSDKLVKSLGGVGMIGESGMQEAIQG